MNRAASILISLSACNRAPLWPDDAWAPNGAAPWFYPSDEACERQFSDEEPVVIDGYRYCGVQQALTGLVPIDDPVYSPCFSVPPDADQEVMYVTNGVRARAYLISAMIDREILHTDWDDVPLVVNYCPIIAGGDVFFRQEIDGGHARYNVVGLWGSANTLAPRHELYAGDYTVYTTWDGHALSGPGRPGTLEAFPALVDYTTIDDFVARFGILSETCEVWTGQETLGVGCQEACEHFVELCPQGSGQQCARECAKYPRAAADCLIAADTCERAANCQ